MVKSYKIPPTCKQRSVAHLKQDKYPVLGVFYHVLPCPPHRPKIDNSMTSPYILYVHVVYHLWLIGFIAVMTLSFSLEKNYSLLSQEGLFVPSSVGLGTNELPSSVLLPHNEIMSEGYHGYDEYFDPPLESKYECPICLLGLREPVQTSCGHRFCKGCILRFMR